MQQAPVHIITFSYNIVSKGCVISPPRPEATRTRNTQPLPPILWEKRYTSIIALSFLFSLFTSRPIHVCPLARWSPTPLHARARHVNMRSLARWIEGDCSAGRVRRGGRYPFALPSPLHPLHPKTQTTLAIQTLISCK